MSDAMQKLVDYLVSKLPPRWEDEYHGTNDHEKLRELFRQRLRADEAEYQRLYGGVRNEGEKT